MPFKIRKSGEGANFVKQVLANAVIENIQVLSSFDKLEETIRGLEGNVQSATSWYIFFKEHWTEVLLRGEDLCIDRLLYPEEYSSMYDNQEGSLEGLDVDELAQKVLTDGRIHEASLYKWQ